MPDGVIHDLSTGAIGAVASVGIPQVERELQALLQKACKTMGDRDAVRRFMIKHGSGSELCKVSKLGECFLHVVCCTNARTITMAWCMLHDNV